MPLVILFFVIIIAIFNNLIGIDVIKNINNNIRSAVRFREITSAILNDVNLFINFQTIFFTFCQDEWLNCVEYCFKNVSPMEISYGSCNTLYINNFKHSFTHYPMFRLNISLSGDLDHAKLLQL